MKDRYFRAKDCAQYLGIGRSTWWRWVSEGKVEEGIHFGSRVTVWPASYVMKLPKNGLVTSESRPA